MLHTGIEISWSRRCLYQKKMASQTQTEVLNKLERDAKSRRVLAGKCATACTACGGNMCEMLDRQSAVNKQDL